MATLATRTTPRVTMTADEFEAFPAGDRRIELLAGELIEMAAGGDSTGGSGGDSRHASKPLPPSGVSGASTQLTQDS